MPHDETEAVSMSGWTFFENRTRLDGEMEAYFARAFPSTSVDAVALANDSKHSLHFLMGDGWLFYNTYWLAMTPASLLAVRVSSWSNRKPEAETLLRVSWGDVCRVRVRESSLALSIWLERVGTGSNLPFTRLNFRRQWTEVGLRLAERLAKCKG